MKICLIAVLSIIAFAGFTGCAQRSNPNADQQVGPESEEVETWTARGRVLLPEGQPAANFEVASFWSANGFLWDESGNVRREMAESDFWINEGVMEPFPQERGGGRVMVDGKFEIQVPTVRSCIVLALNGDRTHGGIASIMPDATQSVSIVLEPLVRVFGEIRCDDETPEWTNVYAFYPGKTKEAPD